MALESRGRAAAPPRAGRFVTTVTDSGSEVPVRMNHKVFVDGLPYANRRADGQPSVEDELMQFAVAWRVGRPVRLIKKDGQGFGFLVLRSPHSVDVAVRVLNGRKFLGRTLRVEVPKLKDSEGAAGAGGNNNGGEDDGKGNFARQVLLSDLARSAQAEIIREILRDVAPQMEKRIESVKMTSRNRKAFLTFASTADVEPAVNFLNGYMMLGRRIAAVPAAAPGSLTYSKTPIRRETQPSWQANENVDSPSGDKENENENEVEEAVIPLGMENAAATKVKKTRSSDTDRRSNVTGVTEKYNLLDKGPAEVFVGNIGEEVTEEQLRAHFAPCGKIEKCEVMVNKSTRLPLGIAHLVFALPAYAAYAQKNFHGSQLHGHVLRVDRGDAASTPIVSDLPPRDDDEIDEDAYMEHYGVKDKKSYFKGTSFEEKEDKQKKSAKKKVNGKRARNTTEATEDEGEEMEVEKPKAKGTKKKLKSDGASFTVSASIPINENSESDDEEHFRDVDDVSVPATARSKTVKGKNNIKPKGTKKGKKSRA